MLSASPNGLHGCPHIFVARHEVPPRGKELVRLYAATFVDPSWIAVDAILQYFGPDKVAVAFDNAGGAPQFQGFFGVERGVDTAEHHPRTTFACDPPDFIAAQDITRVNADADDISGLDGFRV